MRTGLIFPNYNGKVGKLVPLFDLFCQTIIKPSPIPSMDIIHGHEWHDAITHLHSCVETNYSRKGDLADASIGYFGDDGEEPREFQFHRGPRMKRLPYAGRYEGHLLRCRKTSYVQRPISRRRRRAPQDAEHASKTAQIGTRVEPQGGERGQRATDEIVIATGPLIVL